MLLKNVLHSSQLLGGFADTFLLSTFNLIPLSSRKVLWVMLILSNLVGFIYGLEYCLSWQVFMYI